MANRSEFGAFVPTNYIWDVSQLYELEVTDPAFKELLVRLYQNVNNIAMSLNLKDTAYYDTSEMVNSQCWFPNPALNAIAATTAKPFPDFRAVYRKVINFGALPNAATKSVAHLIPINDGYTFTRIYGAASDTTNKVYIPLPYAAVALANNIELDVDATNVNITTGSNRTNFTITYIVMEYIKY